MTVALAGVGAIPDGAGVALRLGHKGAAVLGQATAVRPPGGHEGCRAFGLVADEGAEPSLLPYGLAFADDASPASRGHANP